MHRTLDHDTLARLEDDLGDLEVVREIVGDFLLALPARLDELVDGPAEDRRRMAHTLKSSARLLGLPDLAHRAAELELLAPAWDPQDVADTVRLAQDSGEALRTWWETGG